MCLYWNILVGCSRIFVQNKSDGCILPLAAGGRDILPFAKLWMPFVAELRHLRLFLAACEAASSARAAESFRRRSRSKRFRSSCNRQPCKDNKYPGTRWILPSTTIATVGGYLDHFPLVGTPCELPCYLTAIGLDL